MPASSEPTSLEFFSSSSNISLSNANLNNVAGNQTVHYSLAPLPNLAVPLRSSKLFLQSLYDRIARNAMHDGDNRADDARCHEDTRISVIRDMESWILDPERLEEILWMRGPVGVGKSTVVKTVADRLDYGTTKATLAGSFCFWRGDSTRNNPTRFVPTIAYRLAVTLPEVGQLIRAAIESDPAVLTGRIEYQWRKLVVKPVKEAANERLPAVIIIDGLDECGTEEEQQQILDLISSCGSSFPIAFVVASRPEDHLMAAFAYKFASHYRLSHRVIELGDTHDCRDEMSLYLRSSFASIRRKRQALFLRDPSWPSDDVITRLLSCARGQYIYASTLMKFLNGAKDARIRLDEILSGDSPQVSASAFAPLDKLYHVILEKSHPPEHRLIYTILFHMHYLHSCPLQSPYLAVLYDIGPETVHDSLRNLHSVLKIDIYTLIPSIGPEIWIEHHHTSFLEFLSDPRRSRSYSIHSPHAVDLALLYMKRIPEIWPSRHSLESKKFDKIWQSEHIWDSTSTGWLHRVHWLISSGWCTKVVLNALQEFPFDLWLTQYACSDLSDNCRTYMAYKDFAAALPAVNSPHLVEKYFPDALMYARYEWYYLDLWSGHMSEGCTIFWCIRQSLHNHTYYIDWPPIIELWDLFLRVRLQKHHLSEGLRRFINEVLAVLRNLPDMKIFSMRVDVVRDIAMVAWGPLMDLELDGLMSPQDKFFVEIVYPIYVTGIEAPIVTSADLDLLDGTWHYFPPRHSCLAEALELLCALDKLPSRHHRHSYNQEGVKTCLKSLERSVISSEKMENSGSDDELQGFFELLNEVKRHWEAGECCEETTINEERKWQERFLALINSIN